MSDDTGLIPDDDVAFRLELTPPQLRLLYAALRSYYDDFGHNEKDVRARIRELMDKLPDPKTLT